MIHVKLISSSASVHISFYSIYFISSILIYDHILHLPYFFLYIFHLSYTFCLYFFFFILLWNFLFLFFFHSFCFCLHILQKLLSTFLISSILIYDLIFLIFIIFFSLMFLFFCLHIPYLSNPSSIIFYLIISSPLLFSFDFDFSFLHPYFLFSLFFFSFLFIIYLIIFELYISLLHSPKIINISRTK